MRDSLKKSIDDSPVKNFDRYKKGSIVLCNACAAPIFKLDRGIELGAKAGQSAVAFKPLKLADLTGLLVRDGIDPGVVAWLKARDLYGLNQHVAKLREMKSGDQMICPVCGDCFVQVLNVEANELMDRAFVIELLTIPPEGKPIRVSGKQIGATKGWVH